MSQEQRTNQQMIEWAKSLDNLDVMQASLRGNLQAAFDNLDVMQAIILQAAAEEAKQQLKEKLQATMDDSLESKQQLKPVEAYKIENPDAYEALENNYPAFIELLNSSQAEIEVAVFSILYYILEYNSISIPSEKEKTELRSIKARKGAALAKARGVRLGRPREQSEEARQLIYSLHDQGKSLTQIVNHLTEANIATARGGRWHPSTVSVILKGRNR